MYERMHPCLVDLEKTYDGVACEKLWGVLREYGVDGRLLLAVKSLYSSSDVCSCRESYITTVHRWCLTPSRVCVVTAPFHS